MCSDPEDPTPSCDGSDRVGQRSLKHGGGGSSGLDFTGYSNWEEQILVRVYDNGGPDAVHGVEYILNNNIHVTVGEPYKCFGTGRGRFCTGDWQSQYDIGAWYEGDNRILLNPNDGYKSDMMPDPWGLSLVIHEAKHIEQGTFIAFSKTGEMEAWKINLEIFGNLTGISPENYGLRSQEVHKATTVDAFENAIQTYDKGYWRGLKFLPDRPLWGLISYPYP
jgi:hypothetical protein